MGHVLAPAEAAVHEGGALRRTWIVRAAPVYLPALIVAIGGWSHRWVDEDAFINFRILDQVFAGNGPVFNAGERVEAATSPLWLAVLGVGRVLFGAFLRIEWISVVVGLAAAVAAFVLAGRAARLLHADDDGIVVPVGPLLVASVAVVWDFATSGLEMGLAWLWLAACWYVLVAVATRDAVGGRRRIAFAAVIGLAPLVRPELGVMMICSRSPGSCSPALVACSPTSWRCSLCRSHTRSSGWGTTPPSCPTRRWPRMRADST